MENKQPLLSICIPTYNRANALKENLENMVQLDGFDEDVEIVISDNCSTDNTQEVGEYYASKYSNIKYFRNQENIRDSNFPLALDRASGEYLKLINDTHKVNDDFLIYLKERLLKHCKDRTPVFFTFGVLFNHKRTDDVLCNSLSEYITYISFFVTANQLFGAWREDWANVTNRTKCSKLQLNQVDWTYQILEHKGKCILYTGSGFRTINPGIRKGYNWFTVHVANYYNIMQSYIDKGLISRDALAKEKSTYIKGLRGELLMLAGYKTLAHKDWYFELDGSLKTLYKYFKACPTFYFVLLAFPFWASLTITKDIMRRIYHKF